MNTYTLDPAYTPKIQYWLIDPQGDGSNEEPVESWGALIDWALESYGLFPEIEKDFRENSDGPMTVDEYYISLKDYAHEHLEEIVHQHGWTIRKVIK